MIGVLPQNNGPKKNPVEPLHTCCRLQEAAGQQCQPRGRLQMDEDSPPQDSLDHPCQQQWL